MVQADLKPLPSPPPPPPSGLLTKTQWKQWLASGAPWRPGLDLTVGRQAFVALIGQPRTTQTVGDTALWYYDCSDGTIQVSMSSDSLNLAGLIVGKVNDY